MLIIFQLDSVLFGSFALVQHFTIKGSLVHISYQRAVIVYRVYDLYYLFNIFFQKENHCSEISALPIQIEFRSIFSQVKLIVRYVTPILPDHNRNTVDALCSIYATVGPLTMESPCRYYEPIEDASRRNSSSKSFGTPVVATKNKQTSPQKLHWWIGATIKVAVGNWSGKRIQKTPSSVDPLGMQMRLN
ncbi:hypothetical protein CEXT_565151 [Caerostris extrusa]|uniref:Uncharacterized protein n=1 Tax=Caerostris extrusa TaxID=172846 RepID=A0AAV4X8T1_CAEEX|nr:hypothetical protein CEXT_565151 [Caerostris extrusa]